MLYREICLSWIQISFCQTIYRILFPDTSLYPLRSIRILETRSRNAIAEYLSLAEIFNPNSAAAPFCPVEASAPESSAAANPIRTLS